MGVNKPEEKTPTATEKTPTATEKKQRQRKPPPPGMVKVGPFFIPEEHHRALSGAAIEADRVSVDDHARAIVTKHARGLLSNKPETA